MKELKFNLQRFSYTGSESNDTYSNNNSNTWVYTYGGKDYIWNYGDYVSIDSGTGNDTIDNRGNYSTVIAGYGNDFIHSDPYHSSSNYNNARNSKLYGGYGNDTIKNFANNVSMYGGNDGDSLYNYRYGVAGSTSIYGGENVLMDGGAGNDYIYSGGRTSGGGNVTIVGGTGNDTIDLATDSRNNTILYYYGDGNDIVKNYNFTDTIDLRYNYYTRETVGSDVVLNITNSGEITLVGASGKTINIANGYIGGKYISNTNSNTFISGTDYNDSIKSTGSSNVTISTGDGADTIYNSLTSYKTNSYVSINSGDGNDSIYNRYGSAATILAGEGNDTIYDASWHTSINAGNGDDSVYVNSWDSTTDGGTGNDTITADNTYASINGGEGQDRINLIGSYSNKAKRTVKGGTGNDIISIKSGSGGNIFQYEFGDGYDTIYGYTSYESISIGSSGAYRTVQSGKNIIVEVGKAESTIANGAITLISASGKTLNIIGNKMPVNQGVTLNNTNSNTFISGNGYNDSIKSTGSSNVTISTGDGADTIYNSLTSYKTNSYVSINSGDGNDSIYNRYGSAATILAGEGNDTIYDASWHTSINAGNGDDSVYVNSWDSTTDGGTGNDTITADNTYASINGGEGQDRINLIGSYSNKAKRTVKGGTGNDIISIGSGSGGNIFQYAAGDGYDTIYGATANDSLTITSGSYTTSKSGSDLIVSVGSGGTYTGAITFKNTTSVKVYPTIQSTFTEGNDRATVSNSNSLVSALGGNDYIYNTAQYVTISGDAGSDTIYSYFGTYDKGYLSLIGGADNDSIYSYYGYYSVLDGGTGTDTITNYGGYKVTMYGGIGNDYISNTNGGAAIIDAGEGNDTISQGQLSANTSINAGAGADRITLSGNSTGMTIKGGTGNDYIYNSDTVGHIYQFSSGDGSDTIVGYNSNDKISLDGGYYTRETISSNVVVSLVSGGAISLSGASNQNVNIVGGTLSIKGDDGENISNSKSDTIINTGAGNDTISNTGSTVKIYSGNGDDSIYSCADYNVSIVSGDGNDTIYNAFTNYVSIESGVGDDSIYGNNNWATINAGTGKDTIIGNHYKSKLNGNDGEDLISITSYSYNTVDGGIGEDSIIVGAVYSGNTTLNATGISINGGEGADLISLRGSNSTITGGKDNDTIKLSGDNHLIQYNKGDGNDTIFGFNATDTLQINGVKYKKSKISGTTDVKVSVTGGASVILKDAASLGLNNIKVAGEQDIDDENTYTPQDVIKKFMKALDDTKNYGEAAVDAAVKACSNYTDFNDLIDKLCKECREYIKKDSTNGWKTFLEEKCDIILEGTSDEDTGAITGKDAGGDTKKTAVSVIPEPNSRNTNFDKSSFETNGLTFKIGEYNSWTEKIVEKTYSDLTSNDERFVWQSINSNWGREGLNLIEESYGYSYDDSENKCTTLHIYFDYNTGALAWTNNYNYNNEGRASDLMIGINMNVYKNFSNSDLNGIGYNRYGNPEEYLDRTFTHEMVHAIMASKVKYWKSLPLSVIEGTAELVKGIDDTRPGTIKYMTQNPDYLKHCMSSEYTWKEYQEDSDQVYASGYIMLRYLAKQASTGGDKGGLSNIIRPLAQKVEGVSLSSALIKLTKDFKENSIDFADYYGNVTKLDASTLSSGIVVYGSSASNSLKGSKGADTVFAGAGKDTVLGGNGADVLYGEKDNDLLKGEGGDDTLYGGKGKDTLYGGNNDDVLYGNADDDKLYGDIGNDSLNGGDGNDTLTGGKGADVFIYKFGEGNDTITDYTASQKDKIQIVNGTISQTLYSGKDVTFKIGDGSLTVKKGNSQKISIEYVDESQIQSYWFDEDDDNFVSEDTQLDSISEITEDKYSAENIETYNYDSLDTLQVASSSQDSLDIK